MKILATVCSAAGHKISNWVAIFCTIFSLKGNKTKRAFQGAIQL
jgi:hypothetical protein